MTASLVAATQAELLNADTQLETCSNAIDVLRFGVQNYELPNIATSGVDPRMASLFKSETPKLPAMKSVVEQLTEWKSLHEIPGAQLFSQHENGYSQIF